MALDIPSLIGSAANQIWTQFGSITEPATIEFPDVAPVYDPVTTSFTSTPTVLNNIEVILMVMKGREIDNMMVQAGDEKCFIRIDDLSGNTFNSNTKVTVNGETRRVVSYDLLPSDTDAKLISAIVTKRPE